MNILSNGHRMAAFRRCLLYRIPSRTSWYYSTDGSDQSKKDIEKGFVFVDKPATDEPALDTSFCSMFKRISSEEPKQHKPIIKDTKGLSAKCFKTSGDTPACGGVYKNVQYYSYHRHSFHEAELELNPFRGSQPDAKRKP